MSDEEKVDQLKKNGACYRCLKGGHLARDCSSTAKCTTLVNGSPCDKTHHPLLHAAHINGVTFHQIGADPNKTLFMICSVKSHHNRLTAILDPCSNLTVITNTAARKLNLKGTYCKVTVTKVGNTVLTQHSKEYQLPIHDKHGTLWTVKAYGIDEITRDIKKVDISVAIELFPDFHLSPSRPHGKVEVLIGLNCCKLLPSIAAEVDNLQLMDGLLGYCLRGSHPSLVIEESDPRVLHTDIVVHHTHVSVEDRIQSYFEIEGLGTTPVTPKCTDCQNVANMNISIQERKERNMIQQGLTHDPNTRAWTVKYPWVRDKTELPNNFPGAFGQLKSLERRLLRQPAPKPDLYCRQFTDMVDRGAIRKLTADELRTYEGPVHYLPTHKVEKGSSTTTSLRVMLNPSSNYMGHKLNDYWAKGPNNVASLFGVILRFREEKIAIQGDI